MKPFIFCCALLLCLFDTAEAEPPYENDFPFRNSRPCEVSPQVEGMIRYDNTDVSLCTGRINRTIPLVRLNDPDFDFPIAVSYNGSGFRPTQADNCTGLHWTLQVGGVIYRDIRGVPDDCAEYLCWPRGDKHKTIRGFLMAPLMGYDNESIKQVLMENPEAYLFVGDKESLAIEQYATFIGSGNGTSSEPDIEASSDIYNFSFCGHSGRFILNFDGTASVMSHDGHKYKVDLSHYKIQFSKRKNDSEIRIITDDGYTYCFGGDLSAMEYTALSWTDNIQTYTTRQNQVVAYFLKRIIAPNGRELTLEYLDEVPDDYYQEPRNLAGLSETAPNLDYRRLTSNYQYMRRYSFYTEQAYHISHTLQKMAVLRSVKTDLATVTFSYSPAKSVECQLKFAKDSPGLKLDRVELFDRMHRSLDKCDLTYEYSFPNDRLFLKSLVNREGKYGFRYYEGATVPNTLTSNIDYWGFWRGTPENTTLKPEVYASTEEGYTLKALDDTREPTLEGYDLSLLSDIEFPTGGRVHFEYEPHTYYETYSQDSPDYWYRMQSDGATYFSKPAGGTRIRSIRYFDQSDRPVREKRYQYSTDKAGRYSTGVLMCKPIFALREYIDPHSCDLKVNTQYIVNYSLSNFKQSSAFTDLVQYYLVREYDIANPGQDLSRDSVLMLEITPWQAVREVRKTVNVGKLYSEHRYAKWKITGTCNPNTGEPSRVRIYDAQGTVVWDKSFRYMSEESVILKPVREFGNGTYRIVMEAPQQASLRFRASYRYVREEQFDGPYRETKFTTAYTNSDKNTSRAFVSNPSVQKLLESLHSCIWVMDHGLVQNYLAAPDDRSHERGKVLSVKYFSAGDTLLKKETFRYDRFACEDVVSVWAPMLVDYRHGLGYYSYVNRQNFNSYLPVEKTTATYDPDAGISLEQCETFTYSDDGNLQHDTQKHADGTVERHSYEYVADVPASEQTPAHRSLLERNMGTAPHRTTKSVSADSVLFEPVATTVYAYGLCDLRDGLAPLPVCTSLEEIFPEAMPSNRLEYLRHDIFGNPVHISVNGALSAVYLWGYSGKYLVAKIENATYAQVESVLGADFLNAFPLQSFPDMERLDALRSQLPEARVWTYTYRPGLGISAVTTPAGQRTLYSYDARGRLSETGILAPSGVPQTLQRYEYHIVNE